MTDLLSIEDARKHILTGVAPLQPIELPLAEAYGAVAAADVATDLDIPPFSAAQIDGFAARSADIVTATAEAPVGLRVAGWALAGRPPEVTVGWGEAVRVAAGAPVPAGADCIVPSSSFEVDGEFVRVLQPVPAGYAIRPAGEDVAAGTVLIPAGRRLAAAELGVLATTGNGTVLAYPKLRVGVVSLGELVEPGGPAGFGEVRDASSYLLLGALRDVGASPNRIGIVRGIEKELLDALSSNALRADAFLVSGSPLGGVEGVVSVLGGLGDIRSYSVAMHPGGSIATGLVEGKPFFLLPTGPTAAFVAFEVLVRPAVLRLMGRMDVRRPEVGAVLDLPVSGRSGMA
ncbi:MAG: molybdopterin molybdenumtransferase MoeA, partial [Actinomycetota bacterium]|nr:molybdopterin molybdenumtransferase MoeA [Actinomycetota bacterium]